MKRNPQTGVPVPDWWDVDVTDDDEQLLRFVFDNGDGTFRVEEFEFDTRGNEWGHAVWPAVRARSAGKAAEAVDARSNDDAPSPPKGVRWIKRLPDAVMPYLRESNPADPDARALGEWAWCSACSSPPTKAARSLAQKRWTLPPAQRRVRARTLV